MTNCDYPEWTRVRGDEKLILKMNPKFSVIRRLDSEVIDIEVGFSKKRFEVKKFERNRLETDSEYKNIGWKKTRIEEGLEIREAM